MGPRLATIAVVLGVLCSGQLARADISPSPSTDNDLPTRIEIQSSWGGLGAAGNTVVVIEKDDGRYRFTATEKVRSFGRNGRQPGEHQPQSGVLEASKVRALVAALRAKPLPAPDVANLGITREWLEQQLTRNHIGERIADGAPSQRALFRSVFTSPEQIQKLLPEVAKSFHTDDYPFISVAARIADGETLMACATGQNLSMLPWVLSGSCAHFDADAGPRTVSYNADISRAVAALMPSDATNASRLRGEETALEIEQAVYGAIQDQWNLLGAESKPGVHDALELLRSRFIVRTADVNGYVSKTYGTDGMEEENLHAVLSGPQFPSNVSYALALSYKDGKVDGADAFLNRAYAPSARLFSVPWLVKFIRQHPDVKVRVSYAHNASMDDKAMRNFSADMHKIGRDDLIAEVDPVRDQATLLMTGREWPETYWIVLPDRRLILWRFGGPSGLLKWSPSDFAAKSCADNLDIAGGCVGAVVSASGELQK